MKAAWSYSDQDFARGVHIVPDFEPEPQSGPLLPQYTTLVLLGPQPLTFGDIWYAAVGLGICLLSACSVVALLWWLTKLF